MATEAQRAHIQKLVAKSRAEAAFQTPEEYAGLFEQYLDAIRDDSKKVPSYSGFADWLGNYSRTSVYQMLDKWPELRTTLGQLIADALVEKGIQGIWRDAVVIFTLKNRAGWTDKRESTTHTQSADIATAEEARENIKSIMQSLGFDDRYRPRKGSTENLIELEDRAIRLAEAKAK